MITDKNKSFIMTYGNINIDEHIEKNPLEIVDRPDLKDHHIERFMTHYDPEMRMYIGARQNIEPEHVLHGMLGDSSEYVRANVRSNLERRK